ncbi:MAG: hypothetical protein P4L91_08705 [Burkholderiaceae bacterium]|nr:hypothetical protein [Burkholderiaceae bacterium]
MTTYEFQFSVHGDNRRYLVSPVYAEDGNLKQLSIVQDAPSDKPGQVIHIDLDPAVFKQTAMPGPEVLSRIAIGQARQDKLFGDASYQEGLLLNFAIEPWEGDLTLVVG